MADKYDDPLFGPLDPTREAKVAAWNAAHKAERKRNREGRGRDRDMRFQSACVYLGSTRVHPSLTVGREYFLMFDGSGIKILSAVRRAERFHIPWSAVLDVEVIDGSRMEIKSKVQQRATGGIWAPPGKTAPVSRTYSRHVGQSQVGIATVDGDWLLRVSVEPATLQGKLLLTKGLWSDQASTREQESPTGSAAERLTRLAELHDGGLITEAEYQQTKANILRSL